MLSQLQKMSIRDDRGNCRCQYCGKYRKRDDFPDQPGHIDSKNDHVYIRFHVAAACRFCLDKNK